MRKLLLIALLMGIAIFAFSACGGNNDGDDQAAATPTPPAAGPGAGVTPPPPPPPPEIGTGRQAILDTIPDWPPSGQIVFGSGTWTDQNISSSAWGNPAPNSQARELMFMGLSTMSFDHDMNWFPNPIVSVNGEWPQITDNPDGSRTYTFTIYTDNQFSDGTFITAANYVADIAFSTHPYWSALIPSNPSFTSVYGRHAHEAGEAPTVTGVRLISDNQFSVTIMAEYIPFVWETQLFMDYGPFPIHAAGFEVHDDGDGVFLTNANRTPLTAEAVATFINGGSPEFRVDLVRVEDEYDDDGEPVYEEVVSDVVVGGDGWRFNPWVFSGPYQFVSRDPSTGLMHLTVNPMFPGTWDGFRPRIQDIFFRQVDTPLIVDALVLGEIDMVVGQGGGGTINEMLDRAVGGGTHTFQNYMRNGYGLIRFHVDEDSGAAQFTSTRQAVKWLIDREVFAELFTHGHGVVNHGPYGSAQWWVIEAYARGFLDRIIHYTLNLEMAISILEACGWIYDANGNPFVDMGDQNWANNNFRYRRMPDGSMMRLTLYWATFNVNPITDTIDILLPGPLELAGFELQDYRVVNSLGYISRTNTHPDGWPLNMFNQGLTFGVVWQPWYNWSPERMGGGWNNNFVDNPRLLELSERLRFMDITTEAGRDEFVEAWMDLMVYANYLVLDIPLYVDIWFDFIPHRLQDWVNTSVWGFQRAIQRAYVLD